jgi:hypothetical protein
MRLTEVTHTSLADHNQIRPVTMRSHYVAYTRSLANADWMLHSSYAAAPR